MQIERSRLRLGAFLLLTLATALSLAGDSPDARFRRLGSQLICPCSCTQGALVCNHLGCPVVTQMRAEIAQRARSSDSDGLVLQSFIQEYGTQVIAVPPASGFDLAAWVVPWIAAGAGLVLVFLVVGRWRRRTPQDATASVAPPLDPGVRDQIEREWRS